MFQSLKTVTIHTLEGSEVNRLILEATGHRIDPIGDGDVPGDDSSGHLTLRNLNGEVAPHERADFEKFKETGKGWSSTIIQIFLNDAISRNELPPGTYQIRYSWG